MLSSTDEASSNTEHWKIVLHYKIRVNQADIKNRFLRKRILITSRKYSEESYVQASIKKQDKSMKFGTIKLWVGGGGGEDTLHVFRPRGTSASELSHACAKWKVSKCSRLLPMQSAADTSLTLTWESKSRQNKLTAPLPPSAHATVARELH